MDEINYEERINNYYFKANKSLKFIHNYINNLKHDREISEDRWLKLYSYIVRNLEDY